jgi:hypothetical protein
MILGQYVLKGSAFSTDSYPMETASKVNAMMTTDSLPVPRY